MLVVLLLAFASPLVAASLGAQQLPIDSTTMSLSTRVSEDSLLGSGPMGAWLARERGFTVAVLDARHDRLDRAPTLPLGLQARFPGVSVSQGEGFVGSSSRVWLRGPSSFLLNEPLLIIDGARTHASQPYRGFGPRSLPSRLEDIDPDFIERVEILRGAAASAIYGPGASHGVILVTTKRAVAGPTRWTAFAESGPMLEVTKFPVNTWTPGTSSAGAVVPNCPLRDQAAASCTPAGRQTWSPLESASPFRTGWNTGAGLGVSGGMSAMNYRIDVTHDRMTGVYDPEAGRATNAHLDVNVAATPTVDVRLSGAFRTERIRHAFGDYIALGLVGAGIDDPVSRGYAGGFVFPDEPTEHGRTYGRRLGGALTALWQPAAGTRATVTLGYDELRTHDERRYHISSPGGTDLGVIIDRAIDHPAARSATVRLERDYEYRGVRARTSAGADYGRDDDRGSTLNWEFPADGSPGNGSQSRLHVRRVDYGIYAQQHFGWRRFAMTGALRADIPRGPFATFFSPAVDASWILAGNDQRIAFFDNLRIRGAYGHGGDHLVQTGEETRDFFGFGPSEETADRANELEFGADASLFANRVGVSVTAYHAIYDQSLLRLPSSSGGSSISNDGRIVTRGLETTVDARLIQSPRFTWDAGLIIAAHRSEIRSQRGLRLPPIEYPQHIAHGESLGEYHTPLYGFEDVNGDGLISSSELTGVSAASPPLGSPFPKHEAALRTDVAIGRFLSLWAVLDRRAGQKLYNQTERARCSVANCTAQHDPGTPLAEQARGITARLGSPWGWIEDASYTKLREVSLAVTVPRALIGRATTARLTLTGRNLATWTRYRGLDPEVTGSDPNSLAASGLFIQPPLRTFALRLDLAW